MSAPDDVLFVFAHQDDEVGAFSRIAFEVRAGHRVWCAFLTDGAKKVRPRVRDAESLRVLRRLGVAGERVAFLADGAGRIADGTLVHALQRSRVMLLDWLRARALAPARIYTLDWEGGHHDHDATHLVTLSVARDLGVARRVRVSVLQRLAPAAQARARVVVHPGRVAGAAPAHVAARQLARGVLVRRRIRRSA